MHAVMVRGDYKGALQQNLTYNIQCHMSHVTSPPLTGKLVQHCHDVIVKSNWRFVSSCRSTNDRRRRRLTRRGRSGQLRRCWRLLRHRLSVWLIEWMGRDRRRVFGCWPQVATISAECGPIFCLHDKRSRRVCMVSYNGSLWLSIVA